MIKTFIGWSFIIFGFLVIIGCFVSDTPDTSTNNILKSDRPITDNGLVKTSEWTDTNGFDHVESIFGEPVMGLKIQKETLIHTNVLSEWKPIHRIQIFDGISVWQLEQNESTVQALFFPVIGYRNFDGVKVFGEYESWFYYYTYIRTNCIYCVPHWEGTNYLIQNVDIFKEKCVVTIVKHNDSVIVANIRPEHIDPLEDYGYLSYIGPRIGGHYNSCVLTYYFIKNTNKRWVIYSQPFPHGIQTDIWHLDPNALPAPMPKIITNFIDSLNKGQTNIIVLK